MVLTLPKIKTNKITYEQILKERNKKEKKTTGKKII